MAPAGLARRSRRVRPLYDVLRGRFRIPSEKTLRRVPGLLDPADVSAARFACLKSVLEQITAPPAERTPDGLIEREQCRAHRRAAKAFASTPKRRAYSVDGKCLRGARRLDGSRVFALSATATASLWPAARSAPRPTRYPSPRPCSVRAPTPT